MLNGQTIMPETEDERKFAEKLKELEKLAEKLNFQITITESE